MCDPVTSTALAVGGSALAAGAAFKALTPDIPQLPQAPAAAPKQTDPRAQAARQRERDKARAAAGAQSTILTGSGGLTEPATTASKSLLGS